MPLQLKFHGALETVTGSCHFFRVKASGNIYAVDCGATQGEDDDEQLAIPRNLPADCYPDKLSGIILTHAHGDHISHLPRWFQAGFKGQIICSKETAILTEIALNDSKKIEKRNEKWDVDEDAFDDTVKALTCAKIVQPGHTEILEHNVTIEAAPTSHLLGCCAFRIVAKDKDNSTSVLFTGDIGPIEHEKENMSLYAERKQIQKNTDYIISESTYGSRPRSIESQSGRRRQSRMCEILSKAFRHGDESVVIIPAFSLQRSLDTLVDVFCALQYQRSELGMAKACIPKIIIRSPLSWNYAQVYRDIYFDEIRSEHVFFNKYALIRKIIAEAGDEDIAVIDQLIPHNDRKNGFDGHRLISRLDDTDNSIKTEILWGKGKTESNGPTVIICASGMTLTGPIVELMEEHLRKDTATFVLCGYVPPKSPGGQLRDLWPLNITGRASKTIKLPKDKTSQQPQVVIPGDEIKCGFESISEFYSGHADGPSIIRYILGDNTERADQTKGIFLVHGDHSAREELKKLIEETCVKNSKQKPLVSCPDPRQPWFDCETGEFVGRNTSKQLNSKNKDYVPTLGELLDKDYYLDTDSSEIYSPDVISKLPYELEIESCVMLSNIKDDKDHLMQQIKGAFDYARPEVRGNGLLLKFGRAGKNSAYSTVMIEMKKIDERLFKISAETRIKQARALSEIADIAFDWRRLLNLLEVPKEQYYAGVRWCQTETEIERLLNICSPTVYGIKQRRQPVLILHADTLQNNELQSIERLVTPAVVVAVVHEQYIPTINNRLGLDDEYALTRNNPIYLPIKLKAGAQLIYSEQEGLNLEKLCELVTTDTHIFNGREPLIAKIAQTKTTDDFDAIEAIKNENLVSVQQYDSRPTRSSLPYKQFTSIVTGERLIGKIEYLRLRKSTNTPSFTIVRLNKSNTSGMLHATQMLPNFNYNVGDEIEVIVRQVDAEKRSIYLTQQSLSLPTVQLIEAANSKIGITPEKITALLNNQVTVDAVCKAATKSLVLQGKTPNEISHNTLLDRETTFDTYNRIVQEFELVNTISIPSPEPDKGLTYGDVANQLKYTIEDIINAAAHMISDPTTYQLGMAILPAGFTPTENSSFPRDYFEAFAQECRSRSEKGWSKQFNLDANIKPDCFSITSLAKSMGITDADLVTLMTQKGILPKVQVVLDTEDIKKLIEG